MPTDASNPLRFTLDTSSIIHAVQHQRFGPEVAGLVTLSQGGTVHLYLTGAFEVDMERAREDRLAANLEWLRGRPVIERVPQPFRTDFSPIGDTKHAVIDDDHLVPLKRLESFMLPPHLQPGQFDPAVEPDKLARFRRKVADVQHLVGHLMSGNDYFVTSDEDDMLKPSKRKRIFEASSVRVIDPAEALEIAGQDQTPAR